RRSDRPRPSARSGRSRRARTCARHRRPGRSPVPYGRTAVRTDICAEEFRPQSLRPRSGISARKRHRGRPHGVDGIRGTRHEPWQCSCRPAPSSPGGRRRYDRRNPASRRIRAWPWPWRIHSYPFYTPLRDSQRWDDRFDRFSHTTMSEARLRPTLRTVNVDMHWIPRQYLESERYSTNSWAIQLSCPLNSCAISRDESLREAITASRARFHGMTSIDRNRSADRLDATSLLVLCRQPHAAESIMARLLRCLVILCALVSLVPGCSKSLPALTATGHG